MTKTIRQAELLKWADECLRKGYSVLVTPEGVRVTPKDKEPAKDDFSDVRFDR